MGRGHLTQREIEQDRDILVAVLPDHDEIRCDVVASTSTLDRETPDGSHRASYEGSLP